MTKQRSTCMRGMNSLAFWVRAAAAAAGIALLSLSAAVGAQEKTVWDGVYTEEQAVRGETTYEQECATCHLADLLGDGIAPALTGAAFDFRWSDLSVGDMFVAIRATMPQGAPASLSPQWIRRHRGLHAEAERLSGGRHGAAVRGSGPQHDHDYVGGAVGGCAACRRRDRSGPGQAPWRTAAGAAGAGSSACRPGKSMPRRCSFSV